MDLKFFRQGLYCFINKVHTSVTHEDIWTSEFGQNLFEDEMCGGICTTIFYNLCLSPPGYIISGNNNVTRTRPFPGWIDTPNEIDGPLIKFL